MPRACPVCQTVNADEAGFCPTCGTPLAAPCRNCGSTLPLGARFCPACATPVTGSAAPDAEERKVVTVLFADVTGSTALGERLDPERLRVLLQAYFAGMSAAVEAWGGTVEKYIGDAVMAAFGVPSIREDDAQRALRAALEMLRRLEGLNRDFEVQHGVTLAIRIGVNTGEVIAPMGGAIGQLIVAGDAVNVAARLEQAAEPGTVLVGERTYVAVRDAFRFGEPVDLELKGKAGVVRGRRLLGEVPGVDRGRPEARGPLELRSSMVGRDRELRTMVELLDDAVERGRPHLVLLYGPAGIGKSRLVAEFVASAEGRPRLHVLRGRCPAAGQGITYWPLAEIVRSACGISLTESADSARLKLETSLREILAPLGLGEPDVSRTIDALAHTGGMTLPGSALERAEPRAVADEIAQAWPRFASSLAKAGPTVVVVEDLHWAVDQMREMVERLVARSEGPLVLVATARPEFAEAHPGFASGREDVTVLSLRPLSEQQSDALVRGLLADSALPGDLRDEILARAEGNPFFLEEILGRLIEEGFLVRADGGWRATAGVDAIALPDTIHGLLAARIDGLPAREKRVLQEAAVVGRVFWEDAVRRAMGADEVGGALLALERRGLIVARPTPSMAGHREYAFRHALVREVAYAGLPKARRARSNAAVGAWVKELAADRVDEFIELIAHYYGTAATGEGADLGWADDPDGREAVRAAAFDSNLRAGEAARRRFSLAKAVELHGVALALAADDAERLRAHEAIGDDEHAALHGDEAWASYADALELARRLGDRETEARVAASATSMAIWFGQFRAPPDPAEVDRLVGEGLAATGDPATRAKLLRARGGAGVLWARVDRPDPVPPDDRLRDGREALGIARQVADRELELATLDVLGDMYYKRGDFPAHLEAVRRQVELLDPAVSPSQQAIALFFASEAEAGIAGDHGSGFDLARRSYELARDLSAHELMHATGAMMWIAFRSGRWSEIPGLLAEHLPALEGEADRLCGHIAIGPGLGALYHATIGDTERAEELLALMPEQPAGRIGVALPLHARAMTELGLGRREEARRVAERIIALDRRVVFGWEALVESILGQEDWAALDEAVAGLRALSEADVAAGPIADRAAGVRAVRTGDAAAGQRLLRSALAGFERAGMPYEAARTRERLAEAVDAPERHELLRMAVETYEALGAGPAVERVRTALALVPPTGAGTAVA